MVRSRDVRFAIALAALVAVSGCSRPAHYEPVPCRATPGLVHVLRSMPAIDRVGTVSGTVRSDATEQPIANAIVLLRPGQQAVRADSLGRFEFVGVAPGRYFVEGRQVGYGIRGDSINVLERAGLRIELWLDPVVMDECGMAVTLVPGRPWWKFW